MGLFRVPPLISQSPWRSHRRGWRSWDIACLTLSHMSLLTNGPEETFMRCHMQLIAAHRREHNSWHLINTSPTCFRDSLVFITEYSVTHTSATRLHVDCVYLPVFLPTLGLEDLTSWPQNHGDAMLRITTHVANKAHVTLPQQLWRIQAF